MGWLCVHGCKWGFPINGPKFRWTSIGIWFLAAFWILRYLRTFFPVFRTLRSRALITIDQCDNPPTPPPGQLAVKKGRLSASNPNFSGQALSRRPSSRLLRPGVTSASGSALTRIVSGVQQDSAHTSSEDISLATISFDRIDVVNRVRCVVSALNVRMYVRRTV